MSDLSLNFTKVQNSEAVVNLDATSQAQTTQKNQSVGVIGDSLAVADQVQGEKQARLVNGAYGDQLATPTPTVIRNPFLDPSCAAKIAIILNEVRDLKRQIASKEDEAVQHMMTWMMQNLDVEKIAIDTRADADIIAAKGSLANAAIGLGTSTISLGLMMGTQYKQSKEIKNLENQTRIEKVQTEQKPLEKPQEKEDSARKELDDRQKLQLKIGSEPKNQATLTIGSAAQNQDKDALDLDDDILLREDRALKEELAQKETAKPEAEKTEEAQDKKDMSVADQLKAIQAKYSRINETWGQLSNMLGFSGKIYEDTQKIYSTARGAHADKIKAEVHTSKEMVQANMQQLIHDRQKVDEDFAAIDQMIKQGMSKETEMNAHLYRPI